MVMVGVMARCKLMFHASTVENFKGFGRVVTVMPFGSGSMSVVWDRREHKIRWTD
jgi:hypothetical protein